MIPKLKVVPLGGLGEIGKNMTVLEYGNDIIVIDCGMGFPDETMYGIDVVYPDISYLKLNKEKIRGLILTHGHEDHIGAVPYLLRELDVPIYTTSLTAALVELKLEEHDLLYNSQIFTKKAGSVFRLGCFTIEFIHVNHSIPDTVALAITTPLGMVVHTADFKFDITPTSGKMIDVARLGQLGNEGVLLLLSDSTNVEKPGHSDSEMKVTKSFDTLFKGCEKRIIITTFASNVHRLQQIINVAKKYGRKVAVTGRSMENVMHVSTVLGYMESQEDVIVSLDAINKLPKKQTVIISTGSQGESMSALYRMAFSEHKQIQIDSNDRIIISASAIPGNETMITRVIDELYRKGAEVIYDKHTDLHVSGHAPQEDLKMMLALIRPKYFMPVHGEYRMLVKHAELGKLMGVSPSNIIIGDNGDMIEITKKGYRCEKTVSAGEILVDGSGIGEIGSVVLRDRHRLASDGMVVVVVPYSAETASVNGTPEIVTRGFIYVKDSEELIDKLTQAAIVACETAAGIDPNDVNTMKSKIKSAVTSFLLKETKRTPMVLPVVVEI
ncbi:MAG: ribonuclease J [Eubacteriales bacterium]|nr:ribonuclease J [Eubacteriales bacterium]